MEPTPSHTFARAAPLPCSPMASLRLSADSGRTSGSADTAARGHRRHGPGAASPDTVTFPEGFRATVFADSLGPARHMAVRRQRGPLRQQPALRHRPGGHRPGATSSPCGIPTRTAGPTGSSASAASGGTGGTGIAFYRDQLYVEAGPDDPALSAEPERPGARRARRIRSSPVSRRKAAIRCTPSPSTRTGTSSSTAAQRRTAARWRIGRRGPRESAPARSSRPGPGSGDSARTRPASASAPRPATPRGIRNAVGLAINPADGALYATQHGRDQLAENWPKLFDCEAERGAPCGGAAPDRAGRRLRLALLLLRPGAGEAGAGPRVRRRRQDRSASAPRSSARRRRTPATGRRTRWRSTPATQFPEKYRGGAFIAFHGSWNRAPGAAGGVQRRLPAVLGRQALGRVRDLRRRVRRTPEAARGRPGTGRRGWRSAPTGPSTSVTTPAGGSGGWCTAGAEPGAGRLGGNWPPRSFGTAGANISSRGSEATE